MRPPDRIAQVVELIAEFAVAFAAEPAIHQRLLLVTVVGGGLSARRHGEFVRCKAGRWFRLVSDVREF